jgi:hypothetical protein
LSTGYDIDPISRSIENAVAAAYCSSNRWRSADGAHPRNQHEHRANDDQDTEHDPAHNALES